MIGTGLIRVRLELILLIRALLVRILVLVRWLILRLLHALMRQAIGHAGRQLNRRRADVFSRGGDRCVGKETLFNSPALRAHSAGA